MERDSEVGGGDPRFTVGIVAVEIGSKWIVSVGPGTERFEVVNWLDEFPFRGRGSASSRRLWSSRSTSPRAPRPGRIVRDTITRQRVRRD